MVDIATRVYNHKWKIDPIVRSLIDTDFYKLRWGDEGAWEADILQGPRKGTNIKCRVNIFTSEKWTRASRVRNYTVDFANATFAGKKKVAMHLMELYLQDLQKEMLAL